MVLHVLLTMREEPKKKNSCFRVKNKKIILESTKGIKPNEEIYADYGPDYWPRNRYKNKKQEFVLFFPKKQKQSFEKKWLNKKGVFTKERKDKEGVFTRGEKDKEEEI